MTLYYVDTNSGIYFEFNEDGNYNDVHIQKTQVKSSMNGDKRIKILKNSSLLLFFAKNSKLYRTKKENKN